MDSGTHDRSQLTGDRGMNSTFEREELRDHEGEVNLTSPQSHQSSKDTQPRNRDSEIFQGIVSNDQGVETAFQDIVQDRRKVALKKKTIFRGVLYALILLALGVGLLIVDFYYPTPHLSLVLPVGIGVGILLVIIWFSYRRCGSARWALNWRLKKTSRYLDACQVSDEYVKNMLPQLGPDAEGVCHCRLAGSAGDGFGFFPSLSANVGICHKQPPLTQDVDMNIFYDGLHLQEKDLVTEGLAPGFCWIRLDSRLEFVDTFVSDCVVDHSTIPGRYLSGEEVSNKIGRYIPNNVEYNYPAITYSKTLKGPQGKYDFDVDLVWGIKIPIWPEIASAWPNSSDRHLPRDMIDNIVKRGCYVVHKHCTKNESLFPVAHERHCLDWRFTFAEAESALFRYHYEKEGLKLCYVIIKFVIKLYSTNKKKKFPALKSYHLKTLFLRIAEQDYTKFNMYNIKNNKDLGPLFMHVLAEYKKVLKQENLPHYFMPSVNILSQYTREELDQGIKIIEEFENKPLSTIDAFDKAWLSRQRLDLFFIIGFFTIIFCLGMKFYFDYRKETLLAESKRLFLEAVGEENMDLYDKKEELYECLQAGKDIISDFDVLLKVCRIKLGFPIENTN